MTKEKIFDIDHVLLQKGIMTLFGEVDTKISQSLVESIIAYNLSKDHKLKHLTLLINSEGGDLTDAFAIIDTMNTSKLPIHTVALGQISSAGLIIFMNGSAGCRVLRPNVSIMSHQWFGSVSGKMHELMNAQTDFVLTKTRVAQHYAQRSKLSLEEIDRLLLPPHDVFLTPEQTLDYGIADRIEA